MVTKFAYDVWANKEVDGIYVGKHFAELLVQKNFSFTPDNEVSKLQLSAAQYFLNNHTLLKTKLEFYIKKMMFSIYYRRYIGKNTPYDNKFIGKICYPIFSNVRLSYSYHFQNNTVIPEIHAHSCGIDVLF